MSYTLELCTGEVDRTTWWKDCNTREPANVWWLSGPGTSRPATDVEIDLWRQFAELRGYKTSAEMELEDLREEILQLKATA